ncbi:MAG: glycosyltransferase family 4 protein [Planctomycetota bacterium]
MSLHKTAPPLRIAVWHNLPSGGGKRALWQHVRGLVQCGHQVTAFCPESAAGGYLPLDSLCTVHALPLPANKKPFAPRFLRWWAEARLAAARIASHRAHAQLVAAQIAQGHFDVLFANSCTEFAVPAIGRYVPLPRVLYLGEPRRQFYEAQPDLLFLAPKPAAGAATCGIKALSNSGRALFATRLLMREERDNAALFDRILCNSAFSRESILRAFGIESEVCLLGIDSDRFQPVFDEAKAIAGPFVIGLGAIQPHKGIDRAILAVAALPANLRPRLLWIGNDEGAAYRTAMEQLAANQQVALQFRTQVTDFELVRCLSSALALLYTSRLEPFGLAPLEANACGTPVIAIAEGGVRESLIDGENGLLVADAKPQTIAAALLRLLQEPALLQALRSQCRAAVVDRFSLAAADARLVAALRSTIAAASKAR